MPSNSWVCGYQKQYDRILLMCSHGCEYNSFFPEISNQISEIQNCICIYWNVKLVEKVKKCWPFKWTETMQVYEVDGSWTSSFLTWCLLACYDICNISFSISFIWSYGGYKILFNGWTSCNLAAYIPLCYSEYCGKYMKEIEMKGSKPVKDHSGPGACLHIS